MSSSDARALGWRTPREDRPDLGYVVADLRRTFVRMAANLRWYEQSWLGIPIWQLSDDLVALQRIVCDAKPRWVIETGTKFGGSAIFFSSLLALLGRTPDTGGVITVDITQTDWARQVFEEKPHRLAPFVRRRIIGDASAPETLAAIRETIEADPGRVVVFLDDWHDGDHVYQEMAGCSELVGPGGLLIVADTTFEDIADTPIAAPSGKYGDAKSSNPRVALRRFLSERDDFEVVPGYTDTGISNFPDSVLRRRAGAESR